MISISRVLAVSLLLSMLLQSTASALSPVETKTMVQHYYDEIWNQNKINLAEKYVSDKGVEHDPMMDSKLTTLENIQNMMKMLHHGFPDLHFQIQDILVDGDKVAVRYRLTGTHKGMFMGIEPTGHTMDIEGMELHRLSNGKFVEHWGYMDSLLLLQQLDLMPGM